MTEKSPLDLTRRRALTGVAGIGVAAPVLAACGGDDPAPVTAQDPQRTAQDPPATAGGSPSAGDGGSAGFAATSDIEVGGGAIYPDEQVVITQPTEGEFLAFSALCTHQGCVVAEVTDEGIVCPCHSSVFSLTDGAPQSGPATVALEPVELTVEDGQIFLG